jgi:formate dehydrogenase subunit gamma
MNNGNLIERYKPADRANHWLTAVTFILLALSGLALFHPAFFFLSHLLGGGPWMRILHPFIGVVMAVSFYFLAHRFFADNLMTPADWQWLRQVRDMITNHDERLPPAGRFNAGQKLLFWVMIVTMLLLLLSGVVIWQPWFAPWFSIEIIRIGVILHAAAALVLMLGIIVHIYAGIWVKGTMHGMIRGTVSRAWARYHHPGWYREVTKGTK